jgi:hypothetical protein
MLDLIGRRFAHIHALLGDHGAPRDQLRYLLERPSRISPPFLRADPRWDPLRGDQRFQDLLAADKVRGGGYRASQKGSDTNAESG